MFEITVHIPGLAELAQAIAALASNQHDVPATGSNTPQPAQAAPAASAAPVAPGAAPVSAVQAFAVPVAPGPVTAVPVVPAAPPMPAPVAPAAPAAPTAPITASAAPTSAPTYTLSQIMAAGANLVQAGRAGELQALMQQVGISRLDQLPPEQFGTVAAALRGMGAQI